MERERLRGTSREIVETARELRQRQTEAEARLWQAVRNPQLIPFRVRRQHAYGPYVLDFWIPALRIAIEIDGGIHDSAEIAAQDRERAAWFEAQDILMLRFTNAEVLSNLESVLHQIETHIPARLNRPPRSP